MKKPKCGANFSVAKKKGFFCGAVSSKRGCQSSTAKRLFFETCASPAGAEGDSDNRRRMTKTMKNCTKYRRLYLLKTNVAKAPILFI